MDGWCQKKSELSLTKTTMREKNTKKFIVGVLPCYTPLLW